MCDVRAQNTPGLRCDPLRAWVAPRRSVRGTVRRVKGRLVIQITPADVGRRVSIRSRLHGHEQPVTDTVGYLRAWDAEYLRVERKDGSTATIPAADLLAGKVLPGPPPQRRDR